MFISTFSYDDFNNWNSYAVTLPKGRKDVVKAKYIESILFTIILIAISLILLVGISYIKGNVVSIDETISTLLGTLVSSSIIISLLYPILFKYGAINGRIILFVVVFIIVGIGTLIMQFVDISYIINMLDSLEQWSTILILLFFAVILIVSYFISNKIYKNKEF